MRILAGYAAIGLLAVLLGQAMLSSAFPGGGDLALVHGETTGWPRVASRLAFVDAAVAGAAAFAAGVRQARAVRLPLMLSLAGMLIGCGGALSLFTAQASPGPVRPFGADARLYAQAMAVLAAGAVPAAASLVLLLVGRVIRERRQLHLFGKPFS